MKNNLKYRKDNIFRNLIFAAFLMIGFMGIAFIATGIYDIPRSRQFEKNRQYIEASIVDRKIFTDVRYTRFNQRREYKYYYLVYEFSPKGKSSTYRGDIDVSQTDYLNVPNNTKVGVYYDATNPKSNYEVGTGFTVKGSYFAIKAGSVLVLISSIGCLFVIVRSRKNKK